MQLDVDIEPTLRFPHRTGKYKQMEEPEGSFSPVYGGIFWPELIILATIFFELEAFT